MVHRRRDLDDPAVLGVEVEVAPDAAIGADRRCPSLTALVPRPVGAHLVLAAEHERSGRADADAVAAVDAGRLRQGDRLLGRDPRIEATPRDGDGERVLGIDTAGLDALVAEDAPGVVADIELVVDLDGLRHSRRPLAGRVIVPAGDPGGALA